LKLLSVRGADNLPTPADYLTSVENLNVHQLGDRRAPHKPLLLLLAISRLQIGQRDIPFAEVESALNPLLNAYAPPVASRHQPALPYWHLRSDGLWEVAGADSLPRQVGGFPQMAALRATTGHLEDGFAALLKADPAFFSSVVATILECHFEESLHQDILDSVGLRMPLVGQVAETAQYTVNRIPRDPRFRENILRAYEHRCAVTGFRAALKGQYFGCEAAHIKWHACKGPDTVDNGFAVEPTMHKLFDAGAWTLSDDCRILVSAEFTGGDETIARIRGLHGQSLRSPIEGAPQPSIEFIRWHRDPELGGVFKLPALPI
jgi:putative restriction endonuclease